LINGKAGHRRHGNGGRLFHQLDKFGFDDAQIGGDQPQPVNARGGYYSAVCGVSQVSKSRPLPRDFMSQRENSKHRIGIQALEEFIQGHFQLRSFSASKKRNFQKADCAQSQWFAPLDGRIERSRLRARELFCVEQPSNKDVSVQQQAGNSRFSYFDPAASHKKDVSLFTMSPMIRPFRAQLLRGDFDVARFAGPRTATGRPRRVMVIGPPKLFDLVEACEALALNSDALKTRSLMISILRHMVI
jgi:hypothetical protein